jgi:predicted N-acetyltransferase YhbS
MKLTLRKITAEDAPAVSSLSRQLDYNLSASETATQIQEILDSNNNCAFVALSEEKIIGWIHAFKIETKTL